MNDPILSRFNIPRGLSGLGNPILIQVLRHISCSSDFVHADESTALSAANIAELKIGTIRAFLSLSRVFAALLIDEAFPWSVVPALFDVASKLGGVGEPEKRHIRGECHSYLPPLKSVLRESQISHMPLQSDAILSALSGAVFLLIVV